MSANLTPEYMTPANVISVNPSKIAEGARFPDTVLQNAANVSRITNIRTKTYQSQDPLVSFIFPTRKTGLISSSLLFLARIILGSALVFPTLAGIYFPKTEPILHAAAFTLGIILFIGILARPMAILTAFYFGFTLLENSVTATSIATTAVFVISIIIALIGPGKISIDGIIRHIISHTRPHHSTIPTYKAFSSAE